MTFGMGNINFDHNVSGNWQLADFRLKEVATFRIRLRIVVNRP